MNQSKAQSTAGLPLFERPSEAVVFWTLENLCGGAGGRYMLPLRKLARHCGLSVSTTNRAVLSLTRKAAIQYRRGYNQSRPSIFEIPQDTGEELSHSTGAVAKIGIPPPSDSDNNINNLSIGDINDRREVHKQNEDSESGQAQRSRRGGVDREPMGKEDSGSSDKERLAYRVADGLDDLKNLRLYQSYCGQYPTEVILTAYVRAREVSPDRIKKSRGALFNFLVQKYGGNKNKRSYSGSTAGTAGDGCGRAGRG